MPREIPSSTEVLILGAGPAGLEAALASLRAGYQTVILECDRVVGSAVRRWGHVHMFSPWKYNRSARGAELLGQHDPPNPEYCPTGQEYVEQYLEPLSQAVPVARALFTGVRALAATRHDTLKGEHVGDPRRADAPFRVLWLRDDEGLADDLFEEGIIESRVLIDATGVYDHPACTGSGGIPAAGEMDCEVLVQRHLPDVLGRQRDYLTDRHTLVVGGGFSAATVVRDFARLITESEGTRVTWALRDSGPEPVHPIDHDPLPERVELTAIANRLATDPPPGLTVMRGASVERLVPVVENETEGVIIATLATADGLVDVTADHLVSLTGYRPDRELLSELQVHHCWATDGLMKLSASLLSSAAAGGDCLATSGGSADTLRNPEPGLFIIGAKSYGRLSHYLMRSGCEQVDVIFDELLPAEFPPGQPSSPEDGAPPPLSI